MGGCAARRASRSGMEESQAAAWSISILDGRDRSRTRSTSILDGGVPVSRPVALHPGWTCAGLGAGLAYAAGQVERYAPPPSDVKELLARAHRLRALLLKSADALAVAGMIPAAQVAKIREGRGSIDTAGDCVALAALFQKKAAAV